MQKDMTKAQKQAIGYAFAACNTVIWNSAPSASIASALNMAASDLPVTCSTCSTSWP